MANPTNKIAWPLSHDKVELASTSIQLNYPERTVLKARNSNQEHFYDTATGLFTGSITIAEQDRKDDAHYAILAFLAEMGTNPIDNYTEIDWQKPSIYTINSTFGASSLLNTFNNAAIANVTSISAGVWTISSMSGREATDNIVITPGEHFGYQKQTYRITSANKIVNTETWNITVAPQMTGATAGGTIYQRNYLPVRFAGGQVFYESETGDNLAGPWTINIVEAYVD